MDGACLDEARLDEVTGATGFVAATTIPALQRAGWTVTGALWQPGDAAQLPPGCRSVVVGDIGPGTDWTAALAGVQAVVHLAARVHQDERGPAADAAHARVNTQGTAVLAAAAARAGVSRFVYLSSVKAIGGASPRGRPWTEATPCSPPDAYGSSKLAAEQALAALGETAGLSWCALRPPLVYGPGVRANLDRLQRLILAGRWLPVGGVTNRRSLIFVGNLADLIVRVLERPDITGAFVVRDGEDLSTPELARRLGAALGRPARLLPVPVRVLETAARTAGRSRLVERLFGDLAVDDTLLRSRLEWTPPFTVDEGLRAMAAAVRRGR
ncbi:MAG: NAD-dependent epimerase/dehydratase family protein [bacterium]|nr:NAD-dependent epimerase/dehydratase family protein [bacterium]